MPLAYHALLLEACSDWIDGFRLNGYCPLGQPGGGFGSFWRAWQGDAARLATAARRLAA